MQAKPETEHVTPKRLDATLEYRGAIQKLARLVAEIQWEGKKVIHTYHLGRLAKARKAAHRSKRRLAKA